MNDQTPRLLSIHNQDNVAVVTETVPSGFSLTYAGCSLTSVTEIPKGHKVALKSFEAGDTVIKYGFPIGCATTAIARGAHVHTHNLRTGLFDEANYTYVPKKNVPSPVNEFPSTFDGYIRHNGSAGIRNEIWIIPTVGCVNKTAEALVRNAAVCFAERRFDGVHAFPHPYGCSQLGSDQVITQKVLAGLARHPNAAGVLILGLGCENNNIGVFGEFLEGIAPERIRYVGAQAVEDEMQAGMEALEELADYAETFQRQPLPVSMLQVGLKCGGSDAFSGITANPLLGSISDVLTASGGTTLLTEVPEMFGAETILMDRCASYEVFEKCANLINGFKSYYARHGQPVYENPSPGNKDGGISTLEEKSLGCVQKGGKSPVVDVLSFGESATVPGLNLVNGPGNDMVSVTLLAAAGAHMILFTTGRGTPLGGPVPTLKISSNSELAQRKKGWIDFDAGTLLSGATMGELTPQLSALIIEIASGQRSAQNEINGYREIAIFKDGVTL